MEQKEIRKYTHQTHFHPELNPAGDPTHQHPHHHGLLGGHHHINMPHMPKIDLTKAKAVVGLQRQGSTTSEEMAGSPMTGSPVISPSSWPRSPPPQMFSQQTTPPVLVTVNKQHKPALFKEFDFK